MRNYEEENKSIITREEYRKLKPKKKLKLKRWVKNTLWFILGIATAMTIRHYIDSTQTYTRADGTNYTCSGTIIKICSGNEIR